MVIGCSSCEHDECPLSDENIERCQQGHRVFTGWLFSVICALVFLLPILFAITGSVMVSGDRNLEIWGGIAGFALGWLLSMAITRYCAIDR